MQSRLLTGSNGATKQDSVPDAEDELDGSVPGSSGTKQRDRSGRYLKKSRMSSGSAKGKERLAEQDYPSSNDDRGDDYDSEVAHAEPGADDVVESQNEDEAQMDLARPSKAKGAPRASTGSEVGNGILTKAAKAVQSLIVETSVKCEVDNDEIIISDGVPANIKRMRGRPRKQPQTASIELGEPESRISNTDRRHTRVQAIVDESKPSSSRSEPLSKQTSSSRASVVSDDTDEVSKSRILRPRLSRASGSASTPDNMTPDLVDRPAKSRVRWKGWLDLGTGQCATCQQTHPDLMASGELKCRRCVLQISLAPRSANSLFTSFLAAMSGVFATSKSLVWTGLNARPTNHRPSYPLTLQALAPSVVQFSLISARLRLNRKTKTSLSQMSPTLLVKLVTYALLASITSHARQLQKPAPRKTTRRTEARSKTRKHQRLTVLLDWQSGMDNITSSLKMKNHQPKFYPV